MPGVVVLFVSPFVILFEALFVALFEGVIVALLVSPFALFGSAIRGRRVRRFGGIVTAAGCDDERDRQEVPILHVAPRKLLAQPSCAARRRDANRGRRSSDLDAELSRPHATGIVIVTWHGSVMSDSESPGLGTRLLFAVIGAVVGGVGGIFRRGLRDRGRGPDAHRWWGSCWPGCRVYRSQAHGSYCDNDMNNICLKTWMVIVLLTSCKSSASPAPDAVASESEEVAELPLDAAPAVQFPPSLSWVDKPASGAADLPECPGGWRDAKRGSFHCTPPPNADDLPGDNPTVLAQLKDDRVLFVVLLGEKGTDEPVTFDGLQALVKHEISGESLTEDESEDVLPHERRYCNGSRCISLSNHPQGWNIIWVADLAETQAFLKSPDPN